MGEGRAGVGGQEVHIASDVSVRKLSYEVLTCVTESGFLPSRVFFLYHP